VLAAKSRDTVKKNMALLPAYSLMLGFLALLGYMAIASGIKPVLDSKGKPDANTVVPLLFDKQFPSWFAGVAFAAIAIGALVPAAIMSIAAANTFTRDLYRPYLRRSASAREEAYVSKIVSLVVKFGALIIILTLPVQFAIDFQLIGGIVIIQILPAVVVGLYTRWLDAKALLVGWVVGMALSLWMLWVTPNPLTAHKHFGGANWALSHLGLDSKAAIWIGLPTVVVNLLVSVVLTPVLRGRGRVADETDETDYHLEIGDPAMVAPGST
jgi:SSS family solute:Na+ symporter